MCLIHYYNYRWFKSIEGRGCRPNIASKGVLHLGPRLGKWRSSRNERYAYYLSSLSSCRYARISSCKPKLFSCTVKVPSSLFISVSSMSISCRGYLTAAGDRFQQVPLTVFDRGVRFRLGIVYVVPYPSVFP